MGKRLEKIHTLLSSAKILWSFVIPVLAAAGVYGNSETVRNTVDRIVSGSSVPIADGEVATPTESAPEAWQAQVQQSIVSIVKKLDEHDKRLNSVEFASERDDDGLRALIEENAAKIRYWHE